MLRTIVLSCVIAVLAFVSPLLQAADGITTGPGILGGQKAVKIDLVRAADYLLVPVRINERDAGLFLLDTGAAGVSITSELAKNLNLAQIGDGTLIQYTGPKPAKVHPVGSLSVGGAVQSGTFISSSTSFDTRDGLGVANLNGILGNSFLASVCFRISFAEASLTLYDRISFQPPADARRFDLRMVRKNPLVHATMEAGSLSGWFEPDTGSNLNVSFGGQYVMLNRSSFENRPSLPASSDEYRITLSDLEVFGTQFGSVDANYSVKPIEITDSKAGHFGMTFLRRFDLTFDYVSGAVWVVDRGTPTPVEWDRSGFNPRTADVAGVTPLMRAAEYGLTESAKSFLDAGADVNAKNRLGEETALHYAAKHGKLEMIEALLAKGADVNVRNREKLSPLHVAAMSGPPEAVQTLLDAGAEVDARDVTESTPLLVAAGARRPDVVAVLLEAGADPNAFRKEGPGPLHFAAWAGSVESVRHLLDAGADLNHPSGEQKETPLMFAAAFGRAEVVRFLIESGAGVDAVDAHGRTALSMAAREGWVAVVRQLLDAGARKDVVDKEGKTPLIHAAPQMSPELLALLYDPPATQPSTRSVGP